MDAKLKERIDSMVRSEPVFLFMKGTPSFPQCGFSNQVTQILRAYDVPYGSANVLEDPDIRQGIKEYSDWPTIPQLYIKGEFIGGCDIVRESWESGDLTEMLQDAFPGRTIEAPKPPVKPQNIDPVKAKEMLAEGKGQFLDVRSPEEVSLASIKGFTRLDQQLAQHVLDNGDKEEPLVFICHFGGRSAQAAEYFANQGFQKVYNVVGGIDSWSQTVDSSVPRY
ncbi:MAG: Grx4 family monothiol glutaredoxin [Acidobacteriota bacterium]|nr:Grx4 family monothiol glutaredoxin [Acidobacteriota bacterium]